MKYVRPGIAVALFGFALVFTQVWAQDAPTGTVWDGVYTADQAKRGGALYTDRCMMCHGDTLSGGEQAPPLAGGEFLSNWNGLTAGDLFERIRITMPANNPQSMNRETTTVILAFILSYNQFPAGRAELSTRTEVLKQIRIEAEKPEKK